MEHEASSIEDAFFSMDDLSANMSGINHGRNVNAQLARSLSLRALTFISVLMLRSVDHLLSRMP